MHCAVKFEIINTKTCYSSGILKPKSMVGPITNNYILITAVFVTGEINAIGGNHFNVSKQNLAAIIMIITSNIISDMTVALQKPTHKLHPHSNQSNVVKS